jgi:hypothetical protein
MRSCSVCGRDMSGFSERAKYCTKKCRSKGQYKPWYGAMAGYRAARRGYNLPILDTEAVTVNDLINRDGADCQICGEPLRHPIDMDHVIPTSDPRSTHTMDNLRATHAACNRRRGNARDKFSLTKKDGWTN